MNRKRQKTAFTIAELLISLLLMSILLAAVAVAVRAGGDSYKENDRIASAMQEARGILNRMMTEVRTADAVTCTSTCLTITPPAEAAPLTQIEYEFLNGVLYYRRTVSGTTTQIVLLNSSDTVTVSSLALSRQMTSDGLHTKNLTARLTLASGSTTYPFAATGTLRRNLTY